MRTPQYACQVPRRGRLPTLEREHRQEEVLDAALATLLTSGYAGLTMHRVAADAGASKETLYAWFGSRDGLLAAMIERNADVSAESVARALTDEAEPARTLTAYAVGLLRLLTGPASVALNRAAMTSPDLGALLLASGRHRIGPLVERYLAQQHARGRLSAPDPSAAFRLLYGLVVQDTQIRVLLGEPAPSAASLTHQAEQAVERFLRLLT